MKKTIFNNLGLKIFSVFIAFLIWLMVINGEDPEKWHTFKNIPVTVINEESFIEAGKVYAVKDNSNVVTVKVWARRSVGEKLTANDFTVTADMENITFAETIPLQPTCSDPAISSENITCESPSLKITVENKKEKTFMVSVVTTGQPAAGYEIGSQKIVQGDSVIIEGPASLINIIDKVTAPINVASMSSNKERSAVLNVIDKNGTVFNDSQMERLVFKTTNGEVLTDAVVDVSIILWNVHSIPLELGTIGEPAAGYEITDITLTPATINLAGAEDDLNELNQKLILEDVIDITGKTSTVEESVDISAYLLEHYENKLILETDTTKTISVKIQIEEIGTETLNIPISQVTITGAPDNMDITLTPADQIPVEVRALSSESSQISVKDVQVELDLSTYQTEGNYNKVPVKIKLPDDYELVNNVTIAVNLAKKKSTIEGE